jgi:methionyl aminopeptidase
MTENEKQAQQKLRQSGKILRETREEIKHFVREGMPIIDICEKAEGLIRKKGAKPAFPCNVSINEIAAHYTSPPGDKRVIPEKSVVKVDIGAHIDGYLTDTAVTVCFDPESTDLVTAAERALKAAVENVRAGMSTSKLGSIIDTTIRSLGFKPVSNLTGHQIGRYVVHTGTSLPNVPQLFSSKLKQGGVYAIEPFVTTPKAAGRVENGTEVTIFRFLKSRSTINPQAKKLLKHIEDNFRTLPFAERWLYNVVPEENHKQAFAELLKSKALIQYPVFIEASGKTVAQAEHTILVIEDGCVVLT